MKSTTVLAFWTLLILLVPVAAHANLSLPLDSQRDDCRDTAAKVEEREGSIGFFLMPSSYCTGTLISPHVVLTAGHCVAGIRPHNIRFSLAPDMGQKQEIFYVRAEKVVIHPDYQSPESMGKVHADLALVQLDSKDYGPVVHSFYSLGGAETVPSGVPAVIIGYGTDRHGLKGIKRSKHVRFDSLLPSARDKIFNSQRSLIKIAEGDTGEGPCKGDSGAPVLKYTNGRMAIIGIYSEARARVNQDALSSTKSGVRSRDSYVCRATEASDSRSRRSPVTRRVPERGRPATPPDSSNMV
jgi:V8-like Glu-specific endopeptidase